MSTKRLTRDQRLLIKGWVIAGWTNPEIKEAAEEEGFSVTRGAVNYWRKRIEKATPARIITTGGDLTVRSKRIAALTTYAAFLQDKLIDPITGEARFDNEVSKEYRQVMSQIAKESKDAERQVDVDFEAIKPILDRSAANTVRIIKQYVPEEKRDEAIRDYQARIEVSSKES